MGGEGCGGLLGRWVVDLSSLQIKLIVSLPKECVLAFNWNGLNSEKCTVHFELIIICMGFLKFYYILDI